MTHRSAHEIHAWLREHLAGALGTEPAAIDPGQTFQSFGLGSVDAVVLSGDLAAWLGIELAPTLLWDHPTIDALARHLGEAAAPAGAGAADPAKVAGDEPIAIVGLACRFPGAPDPAAFWQLLVEGRDAVTSVPTSRWSLDDFYDPDPATPGKMSTRWGGFVEGIEDFDPGFFGISPREAKRMDPQQRMLLELAWEGLESAGIVPGTLAGTATGVFVGITASDHGQLALGDQVLEDAYLGTGNALSITANRISYHLDLHGPSLAVDTACSSSLVAVHLACRSLVSGESTLALAAGTNLLLNPALTVNFSKAGFMAPDGRCRAFDASASGYVRGEGAGLVVLEPLSRALARGRRIRAVIAGSAVNQDGRSNGLTAPSRLAQERVLREAYRNARITPGKVQYVEAHGTGTPLGDPIEARALGRVLATERPAGSPCRIGSVKTNIGHLEGAAGIAGLIKVTLALEHGILPPSLHFATPSPQIAFEDLGIEVQAVAGEWGDGERVAGVSSFGFGGTNAHLVVKEAPREAAQTLGHGHGGAAWLLLVSGHDQGALEERALGLAHWLAAAPSLAGIARTLALHRAHLACRRHLVVTDITEAMEGLRNIAGGGPVVAASGSPGDPWRARLAEAGARFDRGEDIPLEELFPEAAPLADLPLYPWQRQRCWILTPVTSAGKRSLGVTDPGAHPLLGAHTALAARPGEDLWNAVLSAQSPSFLDDHRVQGSPVLPAAATVEMMLQAARELAGPDPLEIRDLRLERAVVLPAGRKVHLQMHGVRGADGGNLTMSARIDGECDWSRAATAGWTLGSSGSHLSGGSGPEDLESLHRRCPEPVDVAAHQQQLHDLGLEYRGAFRSLRRIWSGAGEAFGEIDETSVTSGGFQIHPALLDSAFQCLLAAMPREARAGLAMPVAIAHVRWPGRGAPPRWVHARLAGSPGAGPLLSGDLDLFDGTGQRMAEIRGLTLRRLHPAAPGAGSRHLYHVRWIPERFVQDDASDAPRFVPAELPDSLPGLQEALQRFVRKEFFVHVVAPGEAGAEPAGAVQEAVWDLVTSIKKLLEAGGEPPRLWIVTRGAVAVKAGDPVDPVASAIWGLGACAALEAPGLRVTLVDLPPAASGSPVAPDELASLARLIAQDVPESRLAIRGDGAHIARLEPFTAAPPVERAPGPTIRSDASYLITGGLGALGLMVARWLVDQGARRLILAGRRPPGEEAVRVLGELRSTGAVIDVLPVDTASYRDLERALAESLAGKPPLAGVFHAAGFLEDRTLLRLEPEILERVLRPKVAGAANLDRLTRERDLDHFVLFSSAASVVGSPGQGAYGAANAFLDGLAARRRALGLPGTSIAWGPWSAGMAAPRSRGFLPGVLPLEPEEGLAALAAILGSDVTTITCWKLDWEKLRPALGEVPPLLRSLDAHRAVAEPAAAGAGSLAGRLRDVTENARRELLVESLVRRIAQSLGTDPSGVTLDTPLSAMGVDSLMTMELQQWVRTDLGLELPTSELLADPDLERLGAFLLQRLPDGGAAPAARGPSAPDEENVHDLFQDVILPADIQAIDLPRATHQDDILLTGATGYLGAYLLAELLTSTTATIHCLVRTSDPIEGMTRIRQNLEHYRLVRHGWVERVRVVPGDLGNPLLGLPLPAFEALAQQVDAIFHAGAWVNFAYSYPVLEPANVGGTREILRLAATRKLKRVHMISTLGMLLSTAYPKGYQVDEDLADLLWEGLANGYEQSKFVADRVAGLARERGIPVNIYRVGLLSGEAESGAYRKWDDFFPSWIKGCVQLGSIPQLDTLAEMVPVDHVSRSIVAIARQPGWINRNFHLKHEEPIPLSAFADTLERLGHPLRRLPFDQWKKNLLDELARSSDNALHRHLFFVEMLEAEQSVFPRIGTANSRAALEGTGLTCPPASVLLERYFAFFLESGFIS